MPILGRRMEQWSNTSDVDYRATWKSSLFSQVKEQFGQPLRKTLDSSVRALLEMAKGMLDARQTALSH